VLQSPIQQRTISIIDYQNTVALVTGAASGIGRALCLALAARGARVIPADINETGLAETATLLGAPQDFLRADLADPTAPAHLIETIFAKHHRLDLICSNAGLGRNKRLLKEPLDASADRLFAINYWAGLRFAQAYVSALQTHGARGRLMLTASENSLSVPSAVRGAGLGLYAATKHALLITAEWLRDELASANAPLDLHVLLPGAVYTPLVAAAIPDPSKAPPELGLIMPESCANIALRGLDANLFYIPTHAHLAADMRPRLAAIDAALRTLGIEPGP